MTFCRKNLVRLVLYIIIFNLVCPVPQASAYPAITISTPLNNSVVTTNAVDVSGYVTDTAELTVNGSRVYPGVNGFFNCRVSNLIPGNNSLRVKATNASGYQATTVLNVLYDSTAVVPTIVMTNPASLSSEVLSGSLTISGSVYNCDSLTATVNGVPGSPSLSGNLFTFPVTLNAGDNTIILTAHKGSMQAEKVIYIRYNNQGTGKPNIYNLLPADGNVTGGTVTISGTVVNTPAGGLTINGSNVSFNSTNGNFSKVLILSPGTNAIEVRATSGAETFSKTITLNYESSPVIVVTSPAESQVLRHNTVTITGKVFNTASGGLYLNGERLSFNTTDGSFSKTITLTNLRNTFEFRALNGNLVTTKNLTIFYNTSPSITVTSHTYGQTVDSATVILRGTLFPYHQNEIESMTVDYSGYSANLNVSNGIFTSPPLVLQPGDNVFRLTLKTLAAGSIAPQTTEKIFKLVGRGLPEVEVNSPLEGSTVYSNTVTVRGHLRNADFTSLTVDGKTTEIGTGGSFRQSIELDEGENSIEISASYGGTTVNKTLTIQYNKVLQVGSMVKVDVKDADEVKAFDDSVKVKLAKGSLGLNTSLELSVEDPADLDEPPAQSAFLGPLVSLEWGEFTPTKPYKLTLKYDSIVRENQTHKVTVLFFDEDEDEWLILGGIVDSKAETISIETDRTGYFAATMYFKTFDDVSAHWARRDIEYLVAQGAVTGKSTNRFNPDGNVTRAEFVTFLVKSLGWQPYDAPDPSYSDVGRRHWGYEYIEAALRAGLISGVSHNKFAPDRYITREEAGALLARAGNLKALKDQEMTKIFSDFSDSEKISTWAKSELASAIKAKILNGSDTGLFMPRRNTTRAQAAAMIARLSEVTSKSKKTVK